MLAGGISIGRSGPSSYPGKTRLAGFGRLAAKSRKRRGANQDASAMKPLSAGPCSTAMRHSEAHTTASTHSAGMVNERAAPSSESEPAAIAIAAAAAANALRTPILPTHRGRRPESDSARLRFERKCDGGDDQPMNGAGETR